MIHVYRANSPKRIKKKIQPKKIAIIRPNNKFTFVADTLDIIDINFLNSMSDMNRQMKRDPFKHAIWQGIYSNVYPVYKNLELNMTPMSPISEISVYGRQPKYGVDLSKLNLYDVFFNRNKEFMQSFTWEKLLDFYEKTLRFFFPEESHKMKTMTKDWCINQSNIFFDEMPFDSILLYAFVKNVENFQVHVLNRFNGMEENLPDELPSKKFFPQILKQLNANLYNEKNSMFDHLLFSQGGPYRPMKYGYVVQEHGEKVELY